MNDLDMWRKGFKDGKDFSIEQINQHCKTEFPSLLEVILFIREAKKEATDVQD